MTQFALAAHSQIRNVLLCTLATLTLAACGGESGASSAAAPSEAAEPSTAQVASGMIDRSQDADTAQSTFGNVAATAATGSSTTSATSASTTSTASSGTTSSSGAGSTAGTTAGSGTVASTNQSTPPVTTTDGVATLDWMPPTENSDGSVLTNLAGYTVYYGTSPGDLSQSVKVTNPGLAAYTVTGLPSGTWYFAVTSYSADGVESSRTNTVSTQI